MTTARYEGKTMQPRIAYIAAPFAPNEGLSVAQNVENATMLAKVAFASGLAPILVHPNVEQEVYGRDHVPEERVVGLAATRAIAAAVGQAGGEMWMLLLPSGRMSAGCGGEWVAFGQAALAAKTAGTIRLFRLESGKPVAHVGFMPTLRGGGSEERSETWNAATREATGVTAGETALSCIPGAYARA